jgi:DNA polymerase II small subunit
MATLDQLKNISAYFLQNGFILQKNILESIEEGEEGIFLELFKLSNSPKIIYYEFLEKNREKFVSILENFQKEKKFDEKLIEKIKQKFFESKTEESQKENQKESHYLETLPDEFQDLFKPRKAEVKDFIDFFRHRYNFFKEILKSRKELTNLVSIDKLTKSNQNVSVIGMVLSKQETKSKNIILEVEDLKGKVSVLVSRNRKEAYQKALEIVEDEVVGIKGFGNNEIIFASDIIFPEIINMNEKKCKEDHNFVFTSDIHVGSNNFLEANFVKFIKWLNGDISKHKEKSKNITHLFIVGDLIDGIGIYPSQEEELVIKDVKEQYKYLYELLDEIRKDIKIVLIPGNHDAVTLTEPQFFNQYSSYLRKLENVILLPNPTYYSVDNFQILLYHGYSLDFYANNVYALKQQKPYENPDALQRFLLRKRHLAPTHGSTSYVPWKEDYYIIKKVPDIFVTAHIHKTAVSSYRNILLISTSCWQARTAYQERFGHIPDPCKIVIFNTKQKNSSILDFS